MPSSISSPRSTSSRRSCRPLSAGAPLLDQPGMEERPRRRLPDRLVPRRSIYAAATPGIRISAIIPVRAGDAVRVVLAHRAIKDSTYTTVISSTLVLSIFDIAAASALLIWAAVTLDELPGIGELPNAGLRLRLAARPPARGRADPRRDPDRPRDSGRLDPRPRRRLLGPRQAGVRGDARPPAYFGSVVIWQAADWASGSSRSGSCSMPSTSRSRWGTCSSYRCRRAWRRCCHSRQAVSAPSRRSCSTVFGGAVPGAQLLAFSVGMRPDPPGDERRGHLHRDRAHPAHVQLSRCDEGANARSP